MTSAVRQPSIDVFDALGYFTITCACGGESFRILGHPEEEGIFAAPLGLTCSSCGQSSELFDIQEHGYDAELGNGCYSVRGTGHRSEYFCITCKGFDFSIFAGFSYQIEPIEDLKLEDRERTQDLFDWFYLDARCMKCGQTASVSDYECA